MDVSEQLASIVVFHVAIVNDHVVKNAVARMFGFVGHDFAQLFVLPAYPEDCFPSYETSVAILSLVHGVNVQVVVEVTVVEEFDQCLTTWLLARTSVASDDGSPG